MLQSSGVKGSGWGLVRWQWNAVAVPAVRSCCRSLRRATRISGSGCRCRYGRASPRGRRHVWLDSRIVGVEKARLTVMFFYRRQRNGKGTRLVATFSEDP